MAEIKSELLPPSVPSLKEGTGPGPSNLSHKKPSLIPEKFMRN